MGLFVRVSQTIPFCIPKCEPDAGRICLLELLGGGGERKTGLLITGSGGGLGTKVRGTWNTE